MTITIKDNSYELHFGLMALETYTKLSGELEEGTFLQVGQMTALVWAGVQNGAYRLRKTLEISFADVSDAVEDMYCDVEGQKTLVEVMNAFNDSRPVKSFSQKSEEVKKKKGLKKV
jgi:hypothetical protein